MKTCINRRCVAIAMAVALAAPGVVAQSWQTGPVTFIVGFAPGGSSDIAARVVAQQLTARLGQTVVVDNRPGASGVVGNTAIARARPDGQSFLFGSGSLAAGPSLMKSLPYDAAGDFVPVTQVTTIPNILAVHPSVPAMTVKEFVDDVRVTSRPPR